MGEYADFWYRGTPPVSLQVSPRHVQNSLCWGTQVTSASFLYAEVELTFKGLVTIGSKGHCCVGIWLSLTPSASQREHKDAGGSSTVQCLTERDLPSYEYDANNFFLSSVCWHAIQLKVKKTCMFSSATSGRLFLWDLAFFLSKVSMGLNAGVDTPVLLSLTIRGMKFMLVRTSWGESVQLLVL